MMSLKLTATKTDQQMISTKMIPWLRMANGGED